MPLKPWKQITTQDKFKNPWWTYRFDKVIMPNGKEGEYNYVHTGGSVMIIPILDNGKIFMINQYRYLNRRESIELPAGGIKEGEKPIDIAHKELIEETNFDGDLKKVGFFNPFNGVTDEICHVFVARNLKSSSKETKDDCEEFEFLELTPEEIDQKIKSNEIYDGLTMAAWMIGKNYLK
ncbi:NUDIX hydrolase [Patescibacteria group bacterium]